MLKNKISVNVDPHPITEHEKIVVLPFIKTALLKRHLAGHTKEITGRKMIELLTLKAGIKLADSRLRKILYHIRQDGFPLTNGRKFFLCSTHNGYKLSSDPKILQEFIDKEQNRINAQQLTVDAAKRDLENILKLKSKNNEVQTFGK